MKNCECYDKEGNFLGWFSRSVAVVGVTVLRYYDQDGNQENYILASQRGPGTPDPEFVGKWNLCCGYLDFGESCEEAIVRETLEETGVDITRSKHFVLGVNSDPNADKRQNVSIRYGTLLRGKKEDYEKQFSHALNEKDEVGDIKFIRLDEIDNYEWAFNHDDIIRECMDKVLWG